MKPFDIEAAKRGEPVCMVDEREVRLHAFDAPIVWNGEPQPVVGSVRNKNGNWTLYSWDIHGRFAGDSVTQSNLRMAPRKAKRYIVSFVNGTQFGVHPTDCAKKAESLANEYRANKFTDVEITEKEVSL